MKIAIRRGHQRTGQDGCANGIVNEIDVAEAYSYFLARDLRTLGNEVLIVTPSEDNRSLADSLNYGINKANEWGADLFVSCHANNAYDNYNGTIGCEVIYHPNSTTGKNYAINVESQLSNLGFRSRGAKADVRGLSELKNTNMPAIIVEPFFVEATGDIAVWNSVGAEGVARAIAEGITGQKLQKKEEVKVVPKIPKYPETIPEGVFQIPGTKFYIELRTDGDLGIHLDRGNYITIRKGKPPVSVWNDNNGNGGSKEL